MDKDKLEAALRRLEDEQFGRTFKMPGIDAAVLGAWMRWLRDPGIKLENLRGRTRGEQAQPEPVWIVDAVPGKHREG